MDRRELLRTGALGLGAGTLTLAGCLDSVPGVNGEDGENASKLGAASLRRDIEPTGDTKAFDLYLNTSVQEIAPSIQVPVWGFSDKNSGPFQMPGPTIRATAGDELIVNFHNLMDMEHTIHWHGLHVPWDMDGVPYISQEPIPGQQSFEYRFPADPPGTHWYHCHVDAVHHIDMGMYGTIVIEDPEDPWRVGGPNGVTDDVILVLDEVDKNHAHNTSSYANAQDPMNAGPESGNPMDTADKYQTLVEDTADRPPNPNQDNAAAGTNPAQPERDWWPVTYPPYRPTWNTYMLNGKSFPYTQPITLTEGEAKRFRLVHAGDKRHSMHIHGHSFLVTHEDGRRLQSPYWKDTLEIAPGQRYDVIVFGDNPGVWAMHEHSGHANNNDIFPGGIFTVLAYDEYALDAETSAEYVRWYEEQGQSAASRQQGRSTNGDAPSSGSTQQTEATTSSTPSEPSDATQTSSPSPDSTDGSSDSTLDGVKQHVQESLGLD